MSNASIKNNTILNIVKTVSSIIFPLITFPYISRVLLPENVGKVNFSQTFVNYFMLIATLGITVYAIRACALVKNDREKLSVIASQLFSINVITTGVSYVLLILTLIYFRNINQYRFLIVIESSTILFASLGAEWINQAVEDFKFITIRTIAFQLISLILMFIFVRAPSDLNKYAIISVISASGANIINIFYRRKYCDIRFTWKIDWKIHFFPIMYLFVMTLSQTIFNNADTTMLGLMKGNFSVGIYSTAYKMNKIISQVVQSLSYVIIPQLSIYFYKKDYFNVNRLLKKILSFNISLGLPMVVGVIMLSKEIVLIIGGEQFITAAPVLCVLTLGFMFSLVGGSFFGSAIIIPTGNEKYYMKVCCITAVCNVFLNAILIPKYDALGAATATAVNALIILILLSFKIDKNVRITGLSNVFIPPIIGCIFIFICCIICSNIDSLLLRTVSSVITSTMSYLVIQIILKSQLALDVLYSIKIKFKKKSKKENISINERKRLK